jgi:hypothetical protein
MLVICLVCKAKETKEWKIKEENWMQVPLQLLMSLKNFKRCERNRKDEDGND